MKALSIESQAITAAPVRRRRRGQRGSEMIESALVMLAFMFILLGAVEFGRMVFAFNAVSDLAREGSRWASVRGSTASTPATNATVSTYVKTWAVGLNPANLTVTTTWSPNNNPGGTVDVTVAYTWSAILGILVPPSMSFQSSSYMIVLQ
jgi:Flp pilus assembly protein TadG